jgi:hypothetical protein
LLSDGEEIRCQPERLRRAQQHHLIQAGVEQRDAFAEPDAALHLKRRAPIVGAASARER